MRVWSDWWNYAMTTEQFLVFPPTNRSPRRIITGKVPCSLNHPFPNGMRSRSIYTKPRPEDQDVDFDLETDSSSGLLLSAGHYQTTAAVAVSALWPQSPFSAVASSKLSWLPTTLTQPYLMTMAKYLCNILFNRPTNGRKIVLRSMYIYQTTWNTNQDYTRKWPVF